MLEVRGVRGDEGVRPEKLIFANLIESDTE